MNDQHHLIKLILVEGFCKLLLRKVINTRTLVIAKLLEMYFYESTSSDIKTIIKAFLENYSKTFSNPYKDMATWCAVKGSVQLAIMGVSTFNNPRTSTSSP